MISLRFGKFESLVIAQANLHLFSLALISTIPHQCFNKVIDSNSIHAVYDGFISLLNSKNNLLNSFDVVKFLHESSFLGLVSIIEPVLHCTQNILLPNLIPRKIWIISPNETVSVSLPSTSINFCFCQLESTIESNFTPLWCDELEVPFLLYSKSSLLSSAIWWWIILEHAFRWWVHIWRWVESNYSSYL